MIEETDVARLMRAEVDSTERSSAVLDIERAMATGRRQRWYARGAGAALAVAVLAVGAATVPGLVSPDRPSAPSLETAGALAPLRPYTGMVPPADSSRIAAALETVDPGVQYVRFGWLPPGLERVQYQAGLLPGNLRVSLIGHAPGVPNPAWAGVSVNLYPKGATPPAPQVVGIDQRAATISTVPAPDVRGAAATLTQYDVDGTDQLCLRWQYAPDGWAEVRVAPWEWGQDAREIALHVAQKLTFSTTEQVRLPVNEVRVPSNLRLIQTDVSGPLTPSGGRWYAGLTYSSAPSTVEPGAQLAKTLVVALSPYFEVTEAIRAELKGKEPPQPNDTVDGHRAHFAAGADPDWLESLTVYDVQGLTVSIDAHRETLGAQGTKGLFQQLDLAGAEPAWRPALIVD